MVGIEAGLHYFQKLDTPVLPAGIYMIRIQQIPVSIDSARLLAFSQSAWQYLQTVTVRLLVAIGIVFKL